MNTQLFSQTPLVTVFDNRGLSVRDIAYRRHPDTPNATEECITRHQFDFRGFLTQSVDPRLNQKEAANFSYLTDLKGHIIYTQSVDAGGTLDLNDIAGRSVIAMTNISRGERGKEDLSLAVTRTFQYENAPLPGRPLSVTERVNGENARITERFVYAGNTPQEKSQNLAGQCVSYYDTAGLVQTDSVSLTGKPLSVSRKLLRDSDDTSIMADWQGSDVSAWNNLLAAETYTTATSTDATGAVLATTDAVGNLQRVAFDIAGQLSASWLTLKGGEEQVIVKALTYSAAGQKLREEGGNGVVTTYTYEAETQRLIGIKTERPNGHAAGAKVLQDLRYEYDPVGNVLSITNDAEETRFWRNQKVVPKNAYCYDSFYQLVSASGREVAGAGQQGSALPSTLVPLPSDDSVYTNYTRTYTYDSAGNLIRIRHSAPATNNNYTLNITLSERSNRGVISSLTENPADVDALFSASGNPKWLQHGQSLIWTPRGELRTALLVARDGTADDSESYRYDGSSQRILKISSQQTSHSAQVQRALYLPGLEWRTITGGVAEAENLQVVCVGEAGRAQVRVLHWESGKPDGIINDQIRWSYDNLTCSSGLEVDANGLVISMEEYYPYGGTAVWAARSHIETAYKTVRYSGKERDATGLYYYGYRYYQPWAARWLSADPAGTVDGLNLYRMVRNNPLRLTDPDGMAPLDWLDLDTTNASGDIVKAIYQQNQRDGPHRGVRDIYQRMTESTGMILQETLNNEAVLKGIKQKDKEKKSRGMKFTHSKLKNYAAHAGVLNTLQPDAVYKDGFLNLPGSLGNKNTFPGVELIEDKVNPALSQYHPDNLGKSRKWRPEASLGYYRVADTEAFISGIRGQYESSGTDLHAVVEGRIRDHLLANNNVLPKMAGIAGLHAEVQALNYIVSNPDIEGGNAERLNGSYIFTQRLVGNVNEDFPACYNCSGIISGLENVMTGRVNNDVRLKRRNSF